ncbi:50S ribosomal protein L35 [Candidatus Kuenenbacteria bacterium]|nr:50S ribosomal protein L35 [Candidatus Kuenenbacteria bacterium]
MAKQKTIKSLSKRFKLTKNGKIIKPKDSRNHFNAKSSGQKKRNRKVDLTLAETDAKVIRKIIQY